MSCFISKIIAVEVAVRLWSRRKNGENWQFKVPIYRGGYIKFRTCIFKSVSLPSMWQVLVKFRLVSSESSCIRKERWKKIDSGVARILLQGGTGAWRTGSEVRGDKVIQKWKPSGVRSAKFACIRKFQGARALVPYPGDATEDRYNCVKLKAEPSRADYTSGGLNTYVTKYMHDSTVRFLTLYIKEKLNF